MIGQICGKCVFLTFSSSFSSLNFVTFHCVGVVCVGSVAWGGGGRIVREGMLAREGSRVRWIEETQMKTMVCGVLQGSDRHHILFSSPHFEYGW